jgi:hypothetical protein
MRIYNHAVAIDQDHDKGIVGHCALHTLDVFLISQLLALPGRHKLMLALAFGMKSLILLVEKFVTAQ